VRIFTRFAFAGSILAGVLLSSDLVAEPKGPGIGEARAVKLNIPSEPLGDALNELAAQTGLQLIFNVEEVMPRPVIAPPVMGNLTPEAALKLLLANTNVRYKFIDSRTVALSAVGNTTSLSHPGTDDGPPYVQDRLAQSEAAAATLPLESAAKRDRTVAEAASDAESSKLGEIVVTGSRLVRPEADDAQDVQVFDRARIDQSGQDTIASFLSTLPSVSLASTELGRGASTITLRGLPTGTTLVLINGRRVQASGSSEYVGGTDFFDLNTVPLAAVERIEVVADGSSAVYGSDAIAGVVNIILRKRFSGFEANVQHGGADGTQETLSSLAWGKDWGPFAASVVATYQSRSELADNERAITRSNDYTQFGGPNNNYPSSCALGNVYSLDGSPLPGAPPGSNATMAALSANAASRPQLSDFKFGQLNSCPLISGISLIPKTQRVGVFAQASYQLGPSAELFTEIVYSHVDEYVGSGRQFLFGLPGFQQFTLSASNPFNPFGESVGVSGAINDAATRQTYRTEFFRPLLGARGAFSSDWNWEISAWESRDQTKNVISDYLFDSTKVQNALNSSDATTALNPFGANSTTLVNTLLPAGQVRFTGDEKSVNAFIRGNLGHLPSGQVNAIVGGEYDDQSLVNNLISDGVNPPNTRRSYGRKNSAVFGEARLPVWTRAKSQVAGDVVALSIAGRYDHYSDFGSTTNPQIGIEWRPVRPLLLRATYGRAFRAPALSDLYTPQTSFAGPVTDPRNGNNVIVPVTTGGNPALQALTGSSRTFGLTYTSSELPRLKVSLTDWNIKEQRAIQPVPVNFIVDNEAAFPGRVVRDAAGNITAVDATLVNFGSLRVAGIDYRIEYRRDTAFGEFSPSLLATQTYQYQTQLVPGAQPNNSLSRAQDSNDWAPKLKGTAMVVWSRGALGATMDARYVGKYDDYDSTRTIGNFALFDLSLRVDIGRLLFADDAALERTRLEFGGVNVFNRLPQYSAYNSNFTGYDPAQADIRGRFIYGRLAVRF
jgi:iron complex outermembrane receptor protein